MKTKRSTDYCRSKGHHFAVAKAHLDEARPRDEKGEREGQDRVVRGKGPLPSRLEERRGSFVLPSSTRAGIPGELKGWGDILYGKVRTPRDSEVRFHLVERGGTGKSAER